VRLTLAALALALAAPAAAAPKAKLTPLPPYAGAYQPTSVDERGLWGEFDEVERTLRDSPAIIRDEALTGYLKRVLCDTVGADRCAGTRIYVVHTAVPNADMAPNGTMRIWSGMLLRIRSEAELAAVLGHEFAHFEERHSLSRFRANRTAGDIAMWFGIAGGYAAVNTTGAQVSAFGGVSSYQRDQERGADLLSFKYLAASSYRTGAFSDFWQRMMDEADATATGRHQRSTRYDRTAFFGTHPTNLERASYLKRLATEDGGGGDDAIEPYTEATGKWRPQFLADQIKLNDFDGTEYLLAQLGSQAWTPDLLFARGELYRLRGNPRDLVAAAGFYREAIDKGGTDPLARRGLGLSLMRSGELVAGRAALADYLKIRPDAEDAAMLRSLVEQP
jgi:hypothetical protein